MKKILLILILCLAFTITGFCWVAGYDQRVKLTIDQTKIDTANLTNFPVTAFFTDAQCEEIFAEFDADEDFDRGQFALEDDTLLKAEMELFDDSESLGVYHIKIPTTLHATDTDYYFYYDDDAGHNTDYIGIIGSATAAEVWDEWYEFVCHGVDATTSTVLDSTSNSHDGTKNAANKPIQAAGKVSFGQDFVELGNADFITVTASADLNPETGSFTAEAIVKPDDAGNYVTFYDNRENGNEEGWMMRLNQTTAAIAFAIEGHDMGQTYVAADTSCSDGGFHYCVSVRDVGEDEIRIYRDGVSDVTPATDTTTATINSTQDLLIGVATASNYWMDGVLDELRLSKTVRADEWIKATYNSLWDSLLTDGAEETGGVTANAIFFGFAL